MGLRVAFKGLTPNRHPPGGGCLGARASGAPRHGAAAVGRGPARSTPPGQHPSPGLLPLCKQPQHQLRQSRAACESPRGYTDSHSPKTQPVLAAFYLVSRSRLSEGLLTPTRRKQLCAVADCTSAEHLQSIFPCSLKYWSGLHYSIHLMQKNRSHLLHLRGRCGRTHA